MGISYILSDACGQAGPYIEALPSDHPMGVGYGAMRTGAVHASECWWLVPGTWEHALKED